MILNTAEIIAKYGLSVRYVPLTNLKTSYLESQAAHKVRWSNRHRAVKVLKDGGYWLCKRLNERSGSVFWNSATDNRAKTLDESVVLFMNGISDFIHSLFGCLSERDVFTVV